MTGTPATIGFGGRIRAAARAGYLVVQPRMGFSDPALMRAGLVATRRAAGCTVGTITLDSYTRNRDYAQLRRTLEQDIPLNGYPIVSYPARTTRDVLAGVADAEFPVQVRHGSPDPLDILAAMLAVGLHATEGGPVSYCLPYGRTALPRSLDAWRRACTRLAAAGPVAHLETFGGCLMGQLCPPGLLVAVSLLEGLFFRDHGITSVSLSYAQQTHPAQDEEAVRALDRLAGEFLGGVDWHIVVYTYMGVAPRTPAGSRLLGRDAALLAVRAGAARLVVKTEAEAYRIPTIEDNVASLERAAATAAGAGAAGPGDPDSQVYAEARALVEAVLDLHPDVGRALLVAFERGHLDVPFCLHPDNAGRARSYLDPTGRLGWSDIGRMPLHGIADVTPTHRMASSDLLASLTYVERIYDQRATQPGPGDAGALVPPPRRGDDHAVAPGN